MPVPCQSRTASHIPHNTAPADGPDAGVAAFIATEDAPTKSLTPSVSTNTPKKPYIPAIVATVCTFAAVDSRIRWASSNPCGQPSRDKPIYITSDMSISITNDTSIPITNYKSFPITSGEFMSITTDTSISIRSDKSIPITGATR